MSGMYKYELIFRHKSQVFDSNRWKGNKSEVQCLMFVIIFIGTDERNENSGPPLVIVATRPDMIRNEHQV